MALKKQEKVAAGFLTLFALPFAAVGLWASYMAGSTLVTWYEMRNWEQVPARLATADLRTHDSDGVTYEVVAQYRYRYAGHDYDGSRVAVNTMADNLGSFQQDLYSELRSAQEHGEPVIAYVNPINPNEATLNRDLRLTMLLFELIFALVFGGVGVGLLFGVRVGAKVVAKEQALKDRYPNEPWRWKKDWAEGRITGSNRRTAFAAVLFAVIWNLVSSPVLVFLPAEIARGNSPALIALLFPVIGVFLALYAGRAWLQYRRFRVASLNLPRMPVPLGGRLRGSIRVEAEVPVESEFRLTLSCVQSYESGSGNDRSTSERILWQTEWTVPKQRCLIGATGTTIPIDVAVPHDQPATSIDKANNDVTWRLDVSGSCPGPDFWSRFELPVFDAGDDLRAESILDSDASADPPAASPADRPTPAKLATLGIACAPLASGAETWTFQRAQNKSVATTLTLITAIWTAIAVGLWFTSAPVLFPLVFGAFDLIFVWWVADLWFTEYRTVLDRGLLTVTRRSIFGTKTSEISQQFIRSARAQRGMQAGNKLYYDVKLETPDGDVTIASSIGEYAVAAWLASHLSGKPLDSRTSAPDGSLAARLQRGYR